MKQNNCENFGAPGACPIPADFFGPGSDPFSDSVCFRGEPLGVVFGLDFGEADTLVCRSADPFDRCELPSPNPVTVPIEICALNLVSCAPVTVTFNGGQNPEEWDVRVELSSNVPQPGGPEILAVRDRVGL